jgi:alkanesulfonate monooxygenase SsuD/methylene tetrahydromethanopterin reductase-like flavin-dependent oxidoreductase (luciferase family)
LKYGFITPNFDYCGDVHTLVDLAREAEDAGWDGFFLWDHLQFVDREPNADPWIALAAIAARTERIRLGPLITPVPRRHVAKLARETVTLDHLSGGRLILGAGAGAPALPEYTAFGDDGDAKTRAAKLDEGLAALAELWSGNAVSYRGEHVRVETSGFAPPLQRPRIPVWVAGTWPGKKPFRRAARWDGVVPVDKGVAEGKTVTPTELRELVAYVRDHRESNDPFDFIQFGATKSAGDTKRVSAYADAGATWWIESVLTWIVPLEATRARIREGPPRL